MPAPPPPRTKAKKGRKRASPYAQTLILESLVPRIMEEKMTIPDVARAAQIDDSTAGNFLRRKAQEFAEVNRRKFLAFTPRHAATLNATAERQMTIMEQLNAKPLHLWDADDRKLERHAIACLKAISPFLELAARALATAPPLRENPHTSEGENPQDDTPAAPATLGDGL